jgi:hypothetical protein
MHHAGPRPKQLDLLQELMCSIGVLVVHLPVALQADQSITEER